MRRGARSARSAQLTISVMPLMARVARSFGFAADRCNRRAREQRRRHFEPERLGGGQVDDKLELGRLLDRNVGGLFALEDTAGINTSLTVGAVRFIPYLIRPPAQANSRSW